MSYRSREYYDFRYYTKQNLQTPGQAEVHWDNVYKIGSHIYDIDDVDTYTSSEAGYYARIKSDGSGIEWVSLSDINSSLDHNLLNNLQGGTNNEYYHLTENEHNLLINNNDASSLHNHDSLYLKLTGGTINGNLIVTGDLTVQGTITTVDSDNLVVKDNIILLNNGETESGVSLTYSGIEIDRGTENNSQWVFDESDDSWKHLINNTLQHIKVPDIPTDNNHATSKQYVDNAINNIDTNVNSLKIFSKINTPNVVVNADNNNDTLTFINGSNISITGNDSNNQITISVNQGSGSGLDADLLDGLDSSSFVRTDATTYPINDNIYDIGDSTHRYANIYAVNFHGTATSATYADLAEKYTIKNEYEIGDVVCISSDENYDLEVVNDINVINVIGVISEKPAFLMNKELENGIPVALKGKVKCKIKGPVKKGDPLISYFNGSAISLYNININKNEYIKIFAYSLENYWGDDYKLIDVIII